MLSAKSPYFVQNSLGLDLSVIIVNYNVRYFLEQCLHSVLKASANLDVEILVIDNNSQDGSREYLPQRFPGVSFIWQTSNLGFAKANNIAMRQTTGEYVLFLNPDTIVPEDCFEQSLAFMRSRPNAGALGVRMLDGAGFFLKESKRSFPSARASFYKMSGLSAMFPDSPTFSQYYAAHLAEDGDHEVDVLAGAFMMVSKDCLSVVKGFDEDYFMYGEDIDLSYRILKAGFKNYYVSSIVILHFKGESTQKNSKGYVKSFYGAMQLFVNKHYGQRKLTKNLMTSAISIGSFLSSARRNGKKVLRTENRFGSSPQIAIVAGQKRFEDMIRILKYASRPFMIRGRVALNKFDIGIHLGELKDLPELVKKFELDDLLFCEGPMTYKEIITTMHKYRGVLNFLIHSEASDSIVGSKNKNEKGVVIAKSDHK